MMISARIKGIRYICLIIVSTILAGHSFANPIFNEWIESGDDFKAGDYKLQVMWTDDSAYLTGDGYNLDVPLEDCRSYAPFKVCFNDTRLVKDGEVVPDTINDPNVDTEMYLYVYAIIADVKLKRTIGETDLAINEETDVKVVMTNNGSLDATEVEFEDSYPDAIQVSDVEGCTLDDNTVKWTGILRKNAEVKCEYLLTAMEKKSFSSTAEIEYYNGIDDEKLSDKQSFSISDLALEISIDANRSKLISADMALVDVVLTNEANSIIENAAVKFDLPKGLKIIDVGILNPDLSWSGDIEDTLNITFEVQAVRTGDQILSLSIDYEIEGIEQTVSDKKTFKIESDVTAELTNNIEDLRIGEDGKFEITIFNPGSTIYNIVARSSSDAFEDVLMRKDKIGLRNSFTVLDENIKFDEPGTHIINLSVTYENDLGEKFNIKDSYEFTISTKVNKQPKQSDTQTPTEEDEDVADVIEEKISMLPEDKTKRGGIIIIAAVIASALLLIFIKYKVSN